MAKETKKETPDVIPDSRYTKEQLISSGTFANRKDLLNVLLEDGKQYTIAEAEKAMNDWLKKGVE